MMSMIYGGTGRAAAETLTQTFAALFVYFAVVIVYMTTIFCSQRYAAFCG